MQVAYRYAVALLSTFRSCTVAEYPGPLICYTQTSKRVVGPSCSDGHVSHPDK